MQQSRIERLTSDFYQWERMGRGWNVYSMPVDLEPPFVPFFFHADSIESYVDDGKRQTLLSRVGELFKNNEPPPVIEKETEQGEPYPFVDDSPLYAFSISLPKCEKVKVVEMEQLLLMLSYCSIPVSFEIIATYTAIRIQFVCRESDTLHVQSQVKSYFPTVVLNDKSEELFNLIPERKSAYAKDYGLSDEFMRPLNAVTNFDLDPYTGLFGILENINEGEQAVLQIIFKGAVNSWSESIMRSVTDGRGDSFFLDAPEMVPLAKEKISSPLFGVTIRTIGCADDIERAHAISQSIGNALIHFSKSPANRLIALLSDGYQIEHYYDDIMLRQSHRLGMLLNSNELATLVHFPSPSIFSAKLERDTKKTKTAPIITEGHDFVIGKNIHHGKEKQVTLFSEQRLKHTHVIGATGTGKSTLLLNLIINDAKLGNGIAVLDPHGDLIENIIPFIPKDRVHDVIIIDPSDVDYPVGFNILSAHSDIEKEILSSDLVAAFKRLSTSWGDQMNSVFANAILAFLEGNPDRTLVDLRRFLIEKPFRDSYLKTVSDPNIVYYWQKEFPLLKSSSIGPILTRLDIFLRPKLIRNMVAQKKSLDFEDILNSKKILLIKLSQGLIGVENSFLLGTFIVSKIHQAAMARQIQRKKDRSDFFLYIDEFQNFITPSMGAILSGARKYHLGLILAHQDMQQLVKQDNELASSVIANAGTRICFRVGDADAKKFEDGFLFFDAKDLQNLEIGEAIMRVDKPEFDFNIETVPLPVLDNGTVQTLSHYVLNSSRERYATPRNEVEEILKALQNSLIPDKEIPQVNKEEKREELPPIEHKPNVPITELKAKETVAARAEKKAQSEHRYLQSLIKRMAESRGYKASIEEVTPDGKGRVDVSLERNGKRIACEVAMTTTEQWEIHNIQKCLQAGYETIVVCSSDKKNLEKIQKKVYDTLDATVHSKVLLVEPDGLFLYLDQQNAKEASKEERIKGYRVKVEYNAIPQREAEQRKESVVKVIADSIRRNKNKK
jgi:hypothetical protein